MLADVTTDTLSLEVRNPSTGTTIERLPVAPAASVADLVDRARRVQPSWEALGSRGRAKILRDAQSWLLGNKDRVISTIVTESGKTVEDALLPELWYGVHALGFWAAKAPKWLEDEKVRVSRQPLAAGKDMRIMRRPLGVVGVIGPWNFPLLNVFGDAIPALAAGNAVILKPASATPRTSLLMAEMLRDSGAPEDVLQVLIAPGKAAEALIDEVDMVMFTGSTATGKRVLERAAKTLTPVSLELGGNDPMIVLDDADIDRAARCAAQYGFGHAGQICISVERIYADRAVYGAFVERLAELTRSLRVGPPNGPGSVDIGAITTEDQLKTVEEHVADAVANNARVAAGGKRVAGTTGRFHQPTVLADCTHDMLVMREETFGPVLGVMPVSGEQEAIARANDSQYGLAASVFTRNLDRGREVARKLQAGAVSVNDALVHYMALELPMSGWKDSGLGTRHGIEGLYKYTRTQSLMVTRFGPSREPHMYPFGAARTKLISGMLGALHRGGRLR